MSKTDQKDLESWKLVSYSYVAYELYTTVDSYFKAGKIEKVQILGEAVKQGTVNKDDITSKGLKVFEKFDISKAYVKPKHLSTTNGSGAKFLGESKIEAEVILKDAMKNGKIKNILDNGVTKQGKQSYEIIIDAGHKVGTKGENLIKIIISDDGGMLSAYPVK